MRKPVVIANAHEDSSLVLERMRSHGVRRISVVDEILEVLTLAQTQKLARRIPVLLYGSAYWKEIINFDALLRYGVIDAQDLRLFEFVDDVDSAVRSLQTGLEPAVSNISPDFAHSRNTRSERT